MSISYKTKNRIRTLNVMDGISTSPDEEWDPRNLSIHGYLLKTIMLNQEAIMDRLIEIEKKLFKEVKHENNS